MVPRVLIAAVLALLPLSADAAERRIDLSSFESLRVEGAFVVELTSAPSPRGMLSGDAESLRRTEARIEGRTLVLRTDRNAAAPARASASPVVLMVAAPPLSGITVIGGARVQAQAMRGTAMTVTLTGPGEIRIGRADGEQLTANLMGSGHLGIEGGRVGKARLAAHGPATIDAQALDVGDVTILLDGPGEASARARYTATIANNGLGRVVVDGTPKCRITTAGSGAIRCGGK